tara:strand:+ start:1125 stop:1286 length:162 start_codon:yes stop_codon:yes gene_type:complete
MSLSLNTCQNIIEENFKPMIMLVVSASLLNPILKGIDFFTYKPKNSNSILKFI